MERDAHVVLEGDAIPAPLRAMPRAPRTLYLRGTLPDPAAPAVAIVGSRTPSSSGEWLAYAMAREAARAGVVVVSGLARGIDAAAHRGALDAGGPTVAFLGYGIDQVYPRSSRVLHEALARRGALLGEYPPAAEPRPWRFVERNRLIAGFTRGTVVVEAGGRSGALITAGLAVEMGRELWASPGDPRRSTCRGSNRLIRDGAGCLLDPRDLLVALGLVTAGRGSAEPVEPPGLTDAERAVWRAVRDAGSLGAEPLARTTGLAAAPLLEAISLLELRGHLRRVSDGWATGGEGPF